MKIQNKPSIFLWALPLLFVVAGYSLAEEKSAPSEQLVESGTVKFRSTSIAVGIGVQWGEGTLMFEGKEYKFKISGLGIAGAGVATVDAEGRVFNLKDIADFPGTYKGTGMGVTLAAGGGDLGVSNDNGVSMLLSSRNAGVKLSIGGGGMKVELVE